MTQPIIDDLHHITSHIVHGRDLPAKLASTLYEWWGKSVRVAEDNAAYIVGLRNLLDKKMEAHDETIRDRDSWKESCAGYGTDAEEARELVRRCHQMIQLIMTSGLSHARSELKPKEFLADIESKKWFKG